MYKQILAVVDGSEQSNRALKQASQTAVQHSAGLVIAHVIDTRSFPRTSPYGDTLWDEIKKNANELVENSKMQAEALGVKDIRTVVQSGNPRIEIPERFVVDYDADLLVVGGSGLNTVERMLVGSVTEACVRRASSDVLTVKTETDAAVYRNILVAVDGSEQSEHALVKAIDVAKTHEATLKIAHVVEVQGGPYTYDVLVMERLNESDKDIEQKEMLEKYKQKAEDQGVKDVETILHYGNPRLEVPQTLTVQNDIDLLVTAATGRGALKRLFTGSVAHASIHHTPSDVLTVRN
ncbi:universal stress protein [Salicibibacter cibarius]|uniref:Universal stress protein n=1 Tax=Salicibibacter cibarius TaxID=2743000 RepID=A0A7T6Z1Q8_9BACI|nr:universal stress protein [Salicibibacter cibarius]QQK74681.1 universal stress protein [Salicibibacter cibarius]